MHWWGVLAIAELVVLAAGWWGHRTFNIFHLEHRALYLGYSLMLVLFLGWSFGLWVVVLGGRLGLVVGAASAVAIQAVDVVLMTVVNRDQPQRRRRAPRGAGHGGPEVARARWPEAYADMWDRIGGPLGDGSAVGGSIRWRSMANPTPDSNATRRK